MTTEIKIGKLSKSNKAYLRNLVCDLKGISEYNKIMRKETNAKVNTIIKEVEFSHPTLTESRIYELARRKCLKKLCNLY